MPNPTLDHEGKPLPPCPCPHCGTEVDAATAAGAIGARPSPGDLTVCAYCGGLSEYLQNMTLAPTSLGEVEDLETRQALRRAQAAVLRHRPNPNP